MTTDQLALVPDHYLHRHKGGATQLIGWLHARGWSMSLLELDQERRKRGIR